MTRESTYQNAVDKCPLCGSADIHFLYKIERFTPSFDIWLCKDCEFQFMNPLFNEKTISSFYNESYYNGTSSFSYTDERANEKFNRYVWDKRIDKIYKYNRHGNYLDVGSSFGGLLRSASRYYKPHGIELSEYAAEWSKKEFGENIHNGTLDNNNYPASFFSVITMIELIEHIADPNKTIGECSRLLVKNGLLVIQTANMAGLQAKKAGSNYHYYLPGHLAYFNRNNLTYLLQKHGFSKIKYFYPVEFGLLPKLLKSRQNFHKISDYKKWLTISHYHIKSKIHFGNHALTSSLVIYAWKD